MSRLSFLLREGRHRLVLASLGPYTGTLVDGVILMSYWVPAGLVALVVGGVAYLRMENMKVKPGDYVAVNSNSVATPIALPATPPNAQVLIRVDQIAPDGTISAGYVVGYVDAQTGMPTLPGGGAAGIPSPMIRPEWVVGIYRGAPPKLVK